MRHALTGLPLITRRDLFRVGGGLSVAGFVAPGLAARSPERFARSCIFVYLLGGPSHLDMWDLKPDAPAEILSLIHI